MDREQFFATYGISAWAYLEADVLSGLPQIARAGFRWVELFADQGWLPGETPGPAAIRRAADDLGLRIRSVHAPFGIGIGHLDREVADRAAGLVCRAVEGGAEVGASVVVVHVSEKDYVTDRYEESVKVSRELVYRAHEVAQRVGVRLALENLVPWQRPHPRFGCSLAELAREFPEAEIGFCLDTGHAALTGLNHKEEIRAAGDRLLSLHAANTDGQRDNHQMPTVGVFRWGDVEEGLAEIGYRDRLIIEIPGLGEPDAQVARAAELWRAMAGGAYGPLAGR